MQTPKSELRTDFGNYKKLAVAVPEHRRSSRAPGKFAADPAAWATFNPGAVSLGEAL